MNDHGPWAILFIAIIIIALLIYGPMITIWAMNTLFGLNIPTNGATWFAVIWLGSIVGSSNYNTNKN